MKRLVSEISNLKTSLPAGIYLRHGKLRLNIIKFLIVGPEGTPYENDIFEFDVYCPPDYPNRPPHVNFRTTGGGTVCFNPNLYPNVKVCLSLLGTWAGEPWVPGTSTLLQVRQILRSS